MEAKIIACALIGIFLGPVASLAITPVFWFLRVTFYVPFIRRKLREEAEKKGHVVQATLQKYHTIYDHKTDGAPLPTMEEMGTYSYEVNGKTYKYRLLSTTGIPQTITLYYIKKPRKATLANDLGTWEAPWLKFYLIISLVVAVITFVVVMIIG